MIARNDHMQIPKRLRDQQRQRAAQGQQHTQMTLNAVLWGLIKSNAMSDEEEPDETVDAVLTLPVDALKEIPANFGLRVAHDADKGTVSVTALLVKPKSNIILPGGG